MNAESLRFLVVGGSNTALSLLLNWVLQPWIGPVAAWIAAFVLTIPTGYAMHCRWVFRQPMQWSGLLRYPAVQVVNLAVGTAVVAVLVHGLAVDERLAPLLALCVTLPLAFVMVRAAVRHRPE